MAKRRYVTPEGRRRLEERLEHEEEALKEYQSRLGELAEVGGDAWHDNSGFEDQQRIISMQNEKVQALRRQLDEVQVIDPTKGGDEVVVGSRVTFLVGDQSYSFEIVGDGDSDPDKGRLAYNTPLGKVIMRKKVGDKVPFRTSTVEIVEIR